MHYLMISYGWISLDLTVKIFFRFSPEYWFSLILHFLLIIDFLWSHIDNSSSYYHPLFKTNFKFPTLLKHVLWNITFSEQMTYALFSCICTKDLIICWKLKLIHSYRIPNSQIATISIYVLKVIGNCERTSLSVG